MLKKIIILIFLLIFPFFVLKSVSAQSPTPPPGPGLVMIWAQGQNIKISWTKVNGADGYKIYKVIDRGTSPTEFFRASVDKNTILFTDIKGYGCPHAIRFGVSAIFGSSESGKTYSSSWVQRNCSCVDLDFNNNGLLDPNAYNSCTAFSSSCYQLLQQLPPYSDLYYICQDYNKSGFYHTTDVNKDGTVDIFDLVMYGITYDPNNCLCPGGSTPTSTPTPTPSPMSACPLNISQEEGVTKASLNNNWQYVSFVAKASGWVDRVEVKAGNYGGAERQISCKVADAEGHDLSATLSSESFTSASGASWRSINFKNNKFQLTKDQSYRFYCQGPDSWNSLYWIWNAAIGLFKGKTYRVYLCP